MQFERHSIAANLTVLRQGIEVLERIDDAAFRSIYEHAFRSSIGSHVRHCIDFYQAFLSGVAGGAIDYERRERNQQLALDRRLAISVLQDILNALQALSVPDEAAILVHEHGPAEAPRQPAWASSSIGRELQFLLSHTIHHYALIAVLLRLLGIEPGPEFGIAPSTLIYRSKAA